MRSSGRNGFRAAAALLGLLLLLLGATTAHAQETRRVREVYLVGADSLAGYVLGTERVRSLYGNVHLRQEKTDLWADRATQYVDREEIFFTGNVLIVEENDSLSADTVWYDSRNKIGRAGGTVRLADGDVEVFAPSGRYFLDARRAVFEQGVRLVDSLTVLTSLTGEYWTEEKRAEFVHHVQLLEDRTHLDADSVTLLRETEVSIARGAVFIERFGGEDDDAAAEPDSSVRTLLFGDRAYNDNRAGFSRVEGDPVLVQLRTDSTEAAPDTLVVRARVLLATRKDSLEQLVGLGDVRAWRADLAAVSDSVVFERIALEGQPADQDTRIFRNPVAWFERSQVTGDTMRVSARDGSVDTVFVWGNAFVAQDDSVLNRIHQLCGRNLVGLFEDDSLRVLDIGPNAEMIYYLVDEDDRPDGAVQTSGDRAAFLFRRGKLDRVSVRGGTEGTYYPENLLPASMQLAGYQWLPERRPTRVGLLDQERVNSRLAALDKRTLAETTPEGEAAEPIVPSDDRQRR